MEAREKEMEKRELELYIHIPFCVKKCAYCDFLSGPATEAEQQAYVEALLREIEQYRAWRSTYIVTTVFVGGGTPSVLDGAQMERIFAKLRESFVISKTAEITIEVNPGTVTEEKLAAYRRCGINRMSFGLQSVNDDELRLLGRIHTMEEFVKSYRMARACGFGNINIDLISAIPGQTCESWERTLDTVTALLPEHISAYSLIVEEGTPFYELYGEEKEPTGEGTEGESSDKKSLPDEDEERRMYEATEVKLKAAGYVQYEISNYAKPGYACRHNIGYWRRTEYLGIGIGASSLLREEQPGRNGQSGSPDVRGAADMDGRAHREVRLRHIRDFGQYLADSGSLDGLAEDTEVLTEQMQMEETMFLGLRLTDGLRRADFDGQFGRSIDEVYGKVLDKLAAEGLLEDDGVNIRLTRRGTDISNYVLAQFLQ